MKFDNSIPELKTTNYITIYEVYLYKNDSDFEKYWWNAKQDETLWVSTIM